MRTHYAKSRPSQGARISSHRARLGRGAGRSHSPRRPIRTLDPPEPSACHDAVRSLASLVVLLPVVVSGCSHTAPAPHSAPPVLAPVGLRLFHEVALTLPEHGDQTLMGRLSFSQRGQFRLSAETPFGVQLFEVGHDGQALFAEVAAPLRGKFPALGLARSIWRIYLATCEGKSACSLESGAAMEQDFGAPGQLRQRRLRDPGGTLTKIDYEDWQDTQGVLHPHRIRLQSGQITVQVFLSGAERL